MRDQRLPQAIGERLQAAAASTGLPMSKIADVADLNVPDYSANEGPIERYGDPRERGDAYVEAHS